MRFILPCCLALIAASVAAQDAAPVRSRLDISEAWVGERVVIVVELLSPTPFKGSPNFQLPRVPDALIMKSAESPVVSSETIAGHEYFTQRHEVFVYARREGTIAIPPITARFGITGDPPGEREGATPEFVFAAKRPPGAENLGALVTTRKMTVTEIWEAKPGATKAATRTGDAFTRTVVFEAADVPGMVLPELPTAAPDGLRIYPRQALIEDKAERGEQTGKRTQTLSYLCAAAGGYTLPELRFHWWDPAEEELRVEILPPVSFTVVASPAAAESGGEERVCPAFHLILLAGVVALFTWGIWKTRHRLAKSWRRWREGEPVKFRQLLRACRGTDAAVALRAHEVWMGAQSRDSRARWRELAASPAPLADQLRRLQAALFGGETADSDWEGTALARELKKARRMRKTQARLSGRSTRRALRPLNPTR